MAVTLTYLVWGIGIFKSVLILHDPKDGIEREIMCIFRNHACHTEPEDRLIF